MPEGDTVHKLAAAMAPVLTSRRLLSIRAKGRDWGHLGGQLIDAVSSRGKHLLIGIGGAWILRTHLGLYGSWHCYRLGSPWKRPARQASLVLGLDDRVYVLFNAKEMDLLPAGGFRLGDTLRRLGPDLTREHPRAQMLLARARELLDPATPVVDLLLDQRVASGIGNVYKSEILFLTGCSPFSRFGDLTLEEFSSLYAEAARWLRRNFGAGERITREPADGRGPLWVYARDGEPCLRCASEVRRERIGRNPRSTYWCPVCQPDGRGSAVALRQSARSR